MIIHSIFVKSHKLAFCSEQCVVVRVRLTESLFARIFNLIFKICLSHDAHARVSEANSHAVESEAAGHVVETIATSTIRISH